MNLTELYGRDSFDRFGDDLGSLILNYLPAKFKLQFECVCPHWRNVIFKNHETLEYEWGDNLFLLRSFNNNYLTFNEVYEEIAKKFINVNSIQITFTFYKSCKHLEHFKYLKEIIFHIKWEALFECLEYYPYNVIFPKSVNIFKFRKVVVLRSKKEIDYFFNFFIGKCVKAKFSTADHLGTYFKNNLKLLRNAHEFLFYQKISTHGLGFWYCEYYDISRVPCECEIVTFKD